MLDQAVAIPHLKWTAMGAVVAAALAFAPRAHSHVYEHRLVLSAPIEADATYLSVFTMGGPVTIGSHEPGLEPIGFETRAYLSDGCRWLGIETLWPIDATHYSYRYEEAILSCEPGATPARKTPRTGIVTALPYDGHSTRFMM